MKISLSAKISFFAALLTLFTATAVGYVVYHGGNELLIEQAMNDVSRDLERQGFKMTAKIEALEADVSFLTRTPPIQALIRTKDGSVDTIDNSSTQDIWKKRFASILKSLLEEKPQYLQAQYIGIADEGKEIVRVDRDGNHIHRVREDRLQSRGQALYFQNTIKYKTGNIYVSPIELNKEQGKILKPFTPVLHVAMPIFDERNYDIFGIIIIKLDMKHVFLESQSSAPKGSQLYITNNKGDFLIHSDMKKAFGFEFDKTYKIQDDYPELASIFDTSDIDWVSGDTSISLTKDDKALKFLKVSFDMLDQNHFAGFALETPYEVVIAQALALRNRSIILSLVLIVCSMAIGLFMAGYITRPIRKIIIAAESFAKGQYDGVDLPLKSKDEIGRLAHTLKSMAEQIEARTEEIKINEERSLSIINASIDTIITIDEKGIIQSFNSAGEEMFGYSAKDVIGQNVKILMPDPHSHQHDGYLHNYLDTGEKKIIGIDREVEALKKDGSVFPINLAVGELSVGEQRMFVGSIRDITDRKEIEAKIQKYTTELEASKLEAENANHMKSEFLAMISHEIRTPMNGILGVTDLLLETPLSAKQLNYAKTVSNSADSLLTIINDVLDFSKIEAGKMELEEIPFDLMTLSEDVAILLAVRAKDTALELVLRYKPGTPQHLIGDPGRIRQVICNLIGNALKFTKKGYIILTIEECDDGKNAPAGRKYLKVSVEDTGIGIPKDAQEKIFDKFSQVDTSTTRKYGGTGLGLSICQAMAKSMNGEVGFESEEGKGSTFWFTMALAEDTAEHTPLPAPEVLKGLKVMIVDDIEANKILLEEYLTGTLGMICETGLEVDVVLSRLRQATKDGENFDLVLMDYLMPDTNGVELTKKITTDKDIADMPVIMLSSGGVEGGDLSEEGVGFSGFMTKPLRIRDMTQLFAYICDEYHNKGNKDVFATLDDLNPGRSAALEYRNIKFKQPKILLAEDSRVNQTFALEVLESVGCLPELAVNGKQAVKMAKEGKFDLILMDCEMPEMDGFEATSAITKMKENGSIPEAPIVALTAHDSSKTYKKCFESGMCDYVGKPMRKNQLLRVLAKWLPDFIEKQADESFKGKHVLLVEDNHTNQMMAEEMLEEFGFKITVARNGKLAVEAVEKESDKFDVILMDCQMPKMDGFEATRLICAMKEDGKVSKNLPIIALTANAMKDARDKCIEAGMDDYLSKPVRKEELRRSLEKWILKEKTGDSE